MLTQRDKEHLAQALESLYQDRAHDITTTTGRMTCKSMISMLADLLPEEEGFFFREIASQRERKEIQDLALGKHRYCECGKHTEMKRGSKPYTREDVFTGFVSC